MTIIKYTNLGLAFLLELCMLFALGYWGWKAGATWLSRIGLGIGVPVLVAVIWGVLLAPKASVPLPPAVHLLLELVLFGSAVAALVVAERPGFAWVFGVSVVVNQLLAYLWNQ